MKSKVSKDTPPVKGNKAILIDPIRSGFSDIILPTHGRMDALRQYCGANVVASEIDGHIIYHSEKMPHHPPTHSQIWNLPDEKIFIEGSAILVGYDADSRMFIDVKIDREYLAQTVQYMEPEDSLALKKELHTDENAV